MPSVVGLALVGDLSEVVAVAEHLLDLAVGDGACRAALCGAGRESAVSEFVRDVLEGVLPGRVEVEGEFHERRTIGIHGDGVDLAALDVVGDVEVADRSATEGAAVLGFLAHLVGDVGPVFAGAVFVERGEDAVHELPNRGGVDLLRCGDEGDAALLQVGHDDRVVNTVPCEAGELVDDDVVDVVVAADAFEHLLERDSLGHLGCGLSRLHVFADDGQSKLFGFALT